MKPKPTLTRSFNSHVSAHLANNWVSPASASASDDHAHGLRGSTGAASDASRYDDLDPAYAVSSREARGPPRRRAPPKPLSRRARRAARAEEPKPALALPRAHGEHFRTARDAGARPRAGHAGGTVVPEILVRERRRGHRDLHAAPQLGAQPAGGARLPSRWPSHW